MYHVPNTAIASRSREAQRRGREPHNKIPKTKNKVLALVDKVSLFAQQEDFPHNLLCN